MADQARRRSITDRVRMTAHSRGTDVARVRRTVVFHRLLTRVAPHGFVLKGGYCLEVRLPAIARATKDVDLAGRLALEREAHRVEETLQAVLETGPSADGFSFDVDRVRELRRPGSESPAWRIGVTAYLDGKVFERLTVDLVGQVDEVEGGTEPLVVEPPVQIPGHRATTIEAVDVYQHAAEKVHAISKIYADDRPSTRVKDLVDVVLLVEAGLLTEPTRLRRRLDRVFTVREGTGPPEVLPDPPGSWSQDYAVLVAELSCSARTVDTAYRLLRELHRAAMTERNIP